MQPKMGTLATRFLASLWRGVTREPDDRGSLFMFQTAF